MYDPSKRKWKKRSSSLLKKLDFIFEIWVQECSSIKRDLIQRCWLGTSAQENLDQHLWDTNTTQKSKNQSSSLPNSDTPGIGPDTPDPFARSVRVTVPGLKFRFAQSLRTYTRSLWVTFRPTAIFWVRGTNTPSSPLAHSLLPIWRAEHFPKPRKRYLTPPSLSLLEWFLWGIWVRSKQEQGFVLVSLIPTSWALGQEVCYSWGLVLLDG